MKKCAKHKKGQVALHAFSEGNCDMCGDFIQCSDTPVDRICELCSEKHNLCHVCGEDAEE